MAETSLLAVAREKGTNIELHLLNGDTLEGTVYDYNADTLFFITGAGSNYQWIARDMIVRVSSSSKTFFDEVEDFRAAIFNAELEDSSAYLPKELPEIPGPTTCQN